MNFETQELLYYNLADLDLISRYRINEFAKTVAIQ